MIPPRPTAQPLTRIDALPTATPNGETVTHARLLDPALGADSPLARELSFRGLTGLPSTFDVGTSPMREGSAASGGWITRLLKAGVSSPTGTGDVDYEKAKKGCSPEGAMAPAR
jgi:hypothetical protein